LTAGTPDGLQKFADDKHPYRGVVKHSGFSTLTIVVLVVVLVAVAVVVVLVVVVFAVEAIDVTRYHRITPAPKCCGCHCRGCHPTFLPSPFFLASKNLLYQILLFTDKASCFPS